MIQTYTENTKGTVLNITVEAHFDNGWSMAEYEHI